MLDEVGTPSLDGDGRFVVDDSDKADWCGRKLAKIMARQAEVRELAAERIKAITRWRDGQLVALESNARFFEELLARYHEDVLADDPRAKTISLPSGDHRARKQPDYWDFDDARFIEWAKEPAPEFVRTTEEVDRAAAKKRLVPVDRELDREPGLAIDPQTGEVVEGVYVSGAGVRFSFVPKGVSK